VAGLWALVNNAGISSARRGPLDWVTVEDYKQVMEVNLLGTIRVTKTFLPLIKRTRGRIVNMTSIAGRIAAARMGPYCASKFALEAFSDSLRYTIILM
jgi:NAD(P)-dependent dehydrogenase (short-subunit alcohol dehydrogenase family)